MNSYTTVLERSYFEFEDRKSVFIGEAMPVSSEAEALGFVNEVKKKYPDARHHVYAYVLRENFITRFTDDREPQGTAGMPVLDVIRKSGCTDTVIVVTRYFGGTLLGTGGLVHAYTEAALGALRAAKVVTYSLRREYSVTLTYQDYQRVLSELSVLGFKTDKTDFGAEVVICGSVLLDGADGFEEGLREITAARAKCVKIGEKFGF